MVPQVKVLQDVIRCVAFFYVFSTLKRLYRRSFRHLCSNLAPQCAPPKIRQPRPQALRQDLHGCQHAPRLHRRHREPHHHYARRGPRCSDPKLSAPRGAELRFGALHREARIPPPQPEPAKSARTERLAARRNAPPRRRSRRPPLPLPPTSAPSPAFTLQPYLRPRRPPRFPPFSVSPSLFLAMSVCPSVRLVLSI